MKPPVLLKATLNILLYLLILGTISYTFLVVILKHIPHESLPFRINEKSINFLNPIEYYIIGLTIFSRIILIYTLIKFKKLISLFFKREFFTLDSIKITNIIGKTILVVAVFNTVPTFIYSTFFEQNPRTVNYDFASINSFWFTLTIGFFFIFLSKIFQNAKTLKEENELTV